MEHFNKLTPSEAERLAILAEECAEVIQVIGKILRHGYESYHPSNKHMPNRALLEKELGDVCAIAAMMSVDGDVSESAISSYAELKTEVVLHWCHHQIAGDPA